MKKILEVASKLNITEDDLLFYGNNIAKIKGTKCDKKGKLILVTSTSPTPYGEGKTTITIGVNDILNRYGHQSVAVLREPSLGPVFGKKGGATGGGLASVVPEEDINIHFTGDFHAITSANNLLCAAIDNHIYQGNNLQIDPDRILINRCIDMNDRALREVVLQNGRREKFNITTASEVMAIFCLSKDIKDLRKRLGNILIAYNLNNEKIYAKDLNVEGAMTYLLKDAFLPNLVMSKEENPVIIHGGPFANIAHGCNSVVATTLALSLSDYVITEAGFGSDLGGLKFLDIKCRMNQLKPSLILINTTIRSLKYNGKNLQDGICNLQFHIDNMKAFQKNIMVVLNLFKEDEEEEVRYVREFCEKQKIPFLLCDSFLYGSLEKEEFANKIINQCQEEDINFPYLLEDPLKQKIEKLCQSHLKADQIVYTDLAQRKINEINDPYPICIAKTPYSITDDPKKLGYPKGHTMTVTDLKVQNGAKIITVYMGNVITMPGLNKNPNYENYQ